ncbi:MAG: lipoyl(octanoyl) transferase LipB [Bacteroidetes bacterium]|nr:lipoyl(octanoyl) transferase LipB [Bacteroidota bacterium]
MASSRKIKIEIINLGITNYNEVWQTQKKYFEELLQAKIQGKKISKNYIITCQHKHVITLGKSGNENNFKNSNFPDVEFVKIDRGGDITYHGPGQLVVYPILDLENFNLSLRKYIYTLEQAVINTLQDYNIKSGRIDEFTGVWINPNTKNARKIAAIGVKSSRYVTMHGLAFNINPDLNYFNLIIPCGLVGKEVTSIEKELNRKVDFEKVRKNFISELINNF